MTSLVTSPKNRLHVDLRFFGLGRNWRKATALGGRGGRGESRGGGRGPFGRRSMAGGDHGATAAAVIGGMTAQSRREREERMGRTSGSPGCSSRGRRSEGRTNGGAMVLDAAAEQWTESRMIPTNAGTPTRFLARGGRKRRCGAGGGVGRCSDGRNCRHGAAAEGGKKWRRPGTRVRFLEGAEIERKGSSRGVAP